MRFKGITARQCSKIAAATTIALCAGLGRTQAQAQAPYLLPYTINILAGGGTAPVIPTSGTAAPCSGTNPNGAIPFDALGDGCPIVSSSVVGDSDLHDVGVDPIGNVIFIDNGGSAIIRRIDAHSGIVNVLAGSVAATKVCATTIDAYGDGCTANDGKGNAAGLFTAAIPKSRGMAVAKNGDVYIADYSQSLVHKISASTGLMTLVAGYVSGGTPTNPAGNKGLGTTGGYTGDGGAATAADLHAPRGVAVDLAGNVYIADTGNNVIRMVNPAGIISTVVGAYPGSNTNAPATFTGDGGLATQATLNGPEDIEVDASGNLFISDYSNARIRVVYAGGATVATLISLTNSGATAVPGHIYTVMGGGATAYTAGSIALATSVSFAPSNAAAIRKMAIDARDNIYAADGNDNVIFFLDVTTGYMRTIAGTYGQTANATCSTQTDTLGDGCVATSAVLNPNSAMGVAVDAQNNVYISDSGDKLIRKVSLNTSFPATTPASPITQTLLVHFAAGDTPAATNPFTLTGSPDFAISGSPTPCPAANADATTDCLISIVFTPSHPGPDFATLIVKSTALKTTRIALSGVGIASSVALDPGAAALVASGFSSPAGLAQDAAGNTFVADTGNNRIMETTSGGTTSVFAGTGTPGYTGDGAAATLAKLNAPEAVTVTPDGAVYIADTGNNVIRRVDPITGFISTYGGAATALCATPNDTLGDGCIATSAKFSAPSGLTSDASGNVYVSDTGDNIVREIGPSGYVFLTAGGATKVCGSDVNGNGCLATQTIFNAPTGLQIDPSLNLFIADTGNNEVRKLTAASSLVSLFAGTGQPGSSGNGGLATTAQVNAPTGIAVDAADNVYIADTGNHVLRVVNASGTIGSVVGTLGSSGTGTVPGPATGVLLNLPGGVVSTGNGTLAILDSGNNRLLSLNRGSVNLNFGRTNLGTSSPATTIQETSTGSSTANLGYPLFTTTGTPAVFALTPLGTSGCTSSSSTPLTFTPGAACSLSAQFTPAATVTSSATYTETNATTTNASAPSISLTGTGAVLTTTTLATVVTGGSLQYSIPFVVTATLSPAQCNPGAPNCQAGGTITFQVDGTQVGVPVPVSNTSLTSNNVITASTTISGQSVGKHTVVAVYSGDTYYASSTAPALSVTIAQGATTTVVTPTPATVTQFARLTLTAQVTSSTTTIPTGSVAFYAGTTLLGTAGLNPTTGIATLTDTTPATTLGLLAGTYSITGVYSGDSNYATSTSKTAALTVNAEPQGFTISLSSTAVGTAQGSTSSTTVTVTPSNTLSGTLSFACVGMPANSDCTVTPTTLSFTPVPGAPAQQTASITLWTDVSLTAAATATASNHPGSARPSSRPAATSTASLASLLGWPALLAGFAGVLSSRRRLRRNLSGQRLLLVLALIALLTGSATVLTGCFNGPASPGLTPPGTYPVTITVTGPNGLVQSTPLTFTVAAGAAGQL